MFRGLNFSRTAWTPRIRCHLPSVSWFPEASDSRSEVVQFTPRRAAEPKGGVSHFGWWKGVRWDPWLLPLLEPLVLSQLCDRLMPPNDSISSIADCANGLRDMRRGLVFRHTKLLLKCSVSGHFKASRRVGAFRRTVAGAMPARIDKYCVGVGFRRPVIVREADLWPHQPPSYSCFLTMLGSSIQQWGIQELDCSSWACSRRHPTPCRPAG